MDKFLIKGNKRKKTSESTEEIDTTGDVSPSKDVDADYQAPIARSTESHQSNPSTRASASGSVYQSLPPYPDLAVCRTKNLTDKEKKIIFSLQNGLKHSVTSFQHGMKFTLNLQHVDRHQFVTPPRNLFKSVCLT
jgi:hypothetical protein